MKNKKIVNKNVRVTNSDVCLAKVTQNQKTVQCLQLFELIAQNAAQFGCVEFFEPIIWKMQLWETDSLSRHSKFPTRHKEASNAPNSRSILSSWHKLRKNWLMISRCIMFASFIVLYGNWKTLHWGIITNRVIWFSISDPKFDQSEVQLKTICLNLEQNIRFSQDISYRWNFNQKGWRWTFQLDSKTSQTWLKGFFPFQMKRVPKLILRLKSWLPLNFALIF